MASLYDHPRADWTDTKTRAHRFDHTVRGVYLHYPGAGNVALLDDTDPQIAARLRGYRKQHTAGNGWRDIGYNVAVDGRGQSWELRGIDNESGANGGTSSNNEAVAILLLIGDREDPTPAMISGVNRLLAKIRAMHPKATYIRGHQQSPDASTDCPGKPVQALINSGRTFTYSGTPAPEPAVPAVTPDGKLVEDGRAGTATISELQRRLGVPVDGRAAEATWTALQVFLDAPYKDGVISRQSYEAEELGNGIVPRAWEHTGRGSDGSQTVERLQAYVGATVDGIWFEGTTKRLQILMNAYPAAFTPADRGVAKARAEKAGL